VGLERQQREEWAPSPLRPALWNRKAAETTTTHRRCGTRAVEYTAKASFLEEGREEKAKDYRRCAARASFLEEGREEKAKDYRRCAARASFDGGL
jgi:hypothetical protein